MTNKIKRPGRPKKEPTKVINIPTDKIAIVEKILGRSIGENQKPIIRVRVPITVEKQIRKAIK